jgi:hypothetical protein
MPGGPTELYVRSRRALLDALEALEPHLNALVLVGAQAIYLHTGEIDEAIATETKDSDLVVDPDELGEDPRLEVALQAAGFHHDLVRPQPGTWLSTDGIPVDLLVPAAVAPGHPGRRGVDLPEHDRLATRRVPGLEAALVDQEPRVIEALDPADRRQFTIGVAGPAALLVAKLIKIAERQTQAERRRIIKDGHDVYRLLRDVPTEDFAPRFERLLATDVSAHVTREAIRQLELLFGRDEDPGSQMAGQAVAGVGDPALVAAASAALAGELLETVSRSRRSVG